MYFSDFECFKFRIYLNSNSSRDSGMSRPTDYDWHSENYCWTHSENLHLFHHLPHHLHPSCIAASLLLHSRLSWLDTLHPCILAFSDWLYVHSIMIMFDYGLHFLVIGVRVIRCFLPKQMILSSSFIIDAALLHWLHPEKEIKKAQKVISKCRGGKAKKYSLVSL